MVGYKTDLEIAREANKKPIIDLAKEKLSKELSKFPTLPNIN